MHGADALAIADILAGGLADGVIVAGESPEWRKVGAIASQVALVLEAEKKSEMERGRVRGSGKDMAGDGGSGPLAPREVMKGLDVHGSFSGEMQTHAGGFVRRSMDRKKSADPVLGDAASERSANQAQASAPSPSHPQLQLKLQPGRQVQQASRSSMLSRLVRRPASPLPPQEGAGSEGGATGPGQRTPMQPLWLQGQFSEDGELGGGGRVNGIAVARGTGANSKASSPSFAGGATTRLTNWWGGRRSASGRQQN